MNNRHGCGKNIDGWHMCGVMEMGGSLVFCEDCQPAQQAARSPLESQVAELSNDIDTLKKAIASAVVAIENESDMDKASSLLTRALAAVEDFK